MSRLRKKYQEEIKSALVTKFSYHNPMKIPRMTKLVVSMGLAEASKDKNALQDALNELMLLTGQKPYVTYARTSIATFKLREGQTIGAKVTLRGKRMYDFMDSFFNIVCPRIRDFRGFSRKGDGRGCYSLGLDEQLIFPALNPDKVKRTQGMNITFVTSAPTDEECIELLTQLGLPFKQA